MKWNNVRLLSWSNAYLRQFWGRIRGQGYEHPDVNIICVVEQFLLNLPELRKLE